jgi:hypothetical protein
MPEKSLGGENEKSAERSENQFEAKTIDRKERDGAMLPERS